MGSESPLVLPGLRGQRALGVPAVTAVSGRGEKGDTSHHATRDLKAGPSRAPRGQDRGLGSAEELTREGGMWVGCVHAAVRAQTDPRAQRPRRRFAIRRSVGRSRRGRH